MERIDAPVPGRELRGPVVVLAVVVVVAIVAWTGLIGPAGALLAVPLTIATRTLLQPFAGAAWFVALLGPPPGDPGARDARGGRRPGAVPRRHYNRRVIPVGPVLP